MKTGGGGFAILAVMSRSDPLASAVAFIEARLMQPLSLGEIAEAAGLSAFHFSRLFTAACGQSVMAYVRRRRLARAARRLIEEPAGSLAELALDSGFESQQAFTRAFTRQFGVSPGRFRRPGLFPLAPGDPAMPAVPESSALERLEGLKPRGPLRLAGLIGRFDADSVHAIPALWSRLVPRLPLTGQRGWETYGACIYDGPTAAEDFRYMAAVEIEPGAPAPDGLEALEVAPQSYAVWRLTLDGGPLHPQMRAAAQDIWGRRLKAEGLKPSGGPDFELYPGDFDQDRAGSTVEFWVPVAG